VATRLLSTDRYSTLPVERRIPQVRSGDQVDGAAAVRFDRPLVEQPGWADQRVARQIAEVSRAAREQGLAEGYAAGWAQGRRAATEREEAERAGRAERETADRLALTARTQAMLEELARSARALAEQVAPAWGELVDVLVDGAMGVAAAAFGRELAAVDARALEAARTALRLLPAAESVVLHVNPADLELFGPEPGLTGATRVAGVRVTADGAVSPGTAVARTPLQSLPVDLPAAFAAAQEVLRP
jgi:flagellar assembly protein FliH